MRKIRELVPYEDCDDSCVGRSARAFAVSKSIVAARFNVLFSQHNSSIGLLLGSKEMGRPLLRWGGGWGRNEQAVWSQLFALQQGYHLKLRKARKKILTLAKQRRLIAQGEMNHQA